MTSATGPGCLVAQRREVVRELAHRLVETRAFAFETVANRVIDAPVPSQLKKGSDAFFAYKITVSEAMEPFIDKAVGLYEQCIQRGKEFKISNAWTSRALERLNVYKADEYPLQRDAALALEPEDRR